MATLDVEKVVEIVLELQGLALKYKTEGYLEVARIVDIAADDVYAWAEKQADADDERYGFDGDIYRALEDEYNYRYGKWQLEQKQGDKTPCDQPNKPRS